jgi:Flp pilus assembly protein TadD
MGVTKKNNNIELLIMSMQRMGESQLKEANLNKIRKALEMIDKSLKLDPGDSDAWYQKGICLQQLGEGDEASACFQKAEKHRLQMTFDFFEDASARKT